MSHKVWMYSEEQPEGMIFDSDDIPSGWVDTPAKLKGEPSPSDKHTRESLEGIAETEGMKGLRKIADHFGVKDRSKSGMIREILEAQNGDGE